MKPTTAGVQSPDFRTEVARAGLQYEGPLEADGRLHRFKANGDKARNSWYVLFAGQPQAGAFGCWKRGIKETWCQLNGRELSREGWDRVRAQWTQAQAARETEEKALHKKTRELALWLYNRAKPAEPDFPYLMAKGVQPHGGLRQCAPYRDNPEALILPLLDSAGIVQSLQFIGPDGSKRFLAGGQCAGAVFILADAPDKPLVICEGYATGASIREATGFGVVCALNCGNLMAIAQAARAKWPEREIILAADNDRGTDGNPGLTKATHAAQAIGARLAVPQFADLSTKPTDFNDLHQLQGLDAVKTQIETAKPAEMTDIRGRIVEILTSDKIPQPRKRAEVAGAVVLALTERGQFYHHADLRDFDTAMFFDGQRKRLERVRSDAFQAWLSDWLHVNRADALFRFIAAEIETAALSASTSRAILPEAYWGARPGAVYLSNGDGSAVKITAGGITPVDNGTDGILFAAGCTLRPWTLTKPIDPFLNCSLFAQMHCSAAHAPHLLRAWLYSLPTVPRSKPPLCFTGPIGSGKTRLAKGFAELYGIPFVAAKVEEQGEDNFWPAVDAGGIYVLDNADSRTKWLPDTLANASTDGCKSARKLYTNKENVTLRPRAWVIVTTANPTFAADAGLADRLLVARMSRQDSATADASLTDEILTARDGALSHVCQVLAKALLDTQPTPAGLNARHPDFAAFAVRIGRALGTEAETVAALRNAEADKSAFCLENDTIGAALLAHVNAAGSFRGTAVNLKPNLVAIDPDLESASAKRIGKRLTSLWPHLEIALKARSEQDSHTKTKLFSFSKP